MPQKQLENKRNQKETEQTPSRKDKRKKVSEKTTAKKKRKDRKSTPRVRIFPLWLRIVVITIIALFMLALGLMFGYGVIGDGQPLDALKVETWRHIIDIVVKE